MNAPTTHDPLTVTTRDGMSWVRRAVTQDGHGLYAPEGVCSCPEFVMATLVELAEHGIKGQDPLADAVAVMGALPVPLGPESQTPMTAHAASVRLGQYGARPKTWSTATYDSGAEKALHEIAVALDTEVKRLRARVAELESAAGDGSTRTADEDPIAYSLTVEALHASSGAVIEVPGRRTDGVYPQGTAERVHMAPHETPPRPRPTPHDLPEVTASDAIEYGITTDNEYGQRVLDPSADLDASLERLARCQAVWPNSRLVQRTNGGEWAEVTP